MLLYHNVRRRRFPWNLWWMCAAECHALIIVEMTCIPSLPFAWSHPKHRHWPRIRTWNQFRLKTRQHHISYLKSIQSRNQPHFLKHRSALHSRMFVALCLAVSLYNWICSAFQAHFKQCIFCLFRHFSGNSTMCGPLEGFNGRRDYRFFYDRVQMPTFAWETLSDHIIDRHRSGWRFCRTNC